MTLPADTLPALALHLAEPDRLERLRHTDLALSFHDEIKVAVERCRLVVDRPQDRECQVPAGTHEGCGGQVTGHLPPEGEGDVTMRCECGKTWTAAEFRSAGKHLRDETMTPVWVSTVSAALELNVHDRTVRKWVAQGLLTSETRTRGQRRVILVRQADVIAMRDGKRSA